MPKMPKKYEAHIAEFYKDSDGWWAYTKTGWMFPSMQCHTAHEDTWKQLMVVVREMKPCDCAGCKEEMKEEGN